MNFVCLFCQKWNDDIKKQLPLSINFLIKSRCRKIILQGRSCENTACNARNDFTMPSCVLTSTLMWSPLQPLEGRSGRVRSTRERVVFRVSYTWSFLWLFSRNTHVSLVAMVNTLCSLPAVQVWPVSVAPVPLWANLRLLTDRSCAEFPIFEQQPARLVSGKHRRSSASSADLSAPTVALAFFSRAPFCWSEHRPSEWFSILLVEVSCSFSPNKPTRLSWQRRSTRRMLPDSFAQARAMSSFSGESHFTRPTTCCPKSSGQSERETWNRKWTQGECEKERGKHER